MDSALIGTLVILLQDGQFMQGYEAGYEHYIQTYRHSSMQDNGVYAFLIKAVSDIRNQDRKNAGFVTGWYAAMFGQNTQGVISVPILLEEA